MQPLKLKHQRPEDKIREEIRQMLVLRGWYVKILHGNEFQSGMPDLFAAKRSYGQRLIEVKNPVKYCFTAAQMETFPKLQAEGVGIWILVAATELEYQKLFLPANWYQYL